jgi:hypothetical protein
VPEHVHRPLSKEDELPAKPYIDAWPKLLVVVVHLRKKEARKVAGRRPRLGYQDVVQVPRHFYVQLRLCDLVVLSVPPGIA